MVANTPFEVMGIQLLHAGVLIFDLYFFDFCKRVYITATFPQQQKT